MANNLSAAQEPQKFSFSPGVRRRFAQIGGLFLLQAGLIFLSAGRLDWSAAWIYLGLFVLYVTANFVLLVPKGTALIEERAQPGAPEEWDRPITTVMSISSLAILVVAGLDARFGWSAAGWQTLLVGGCAFALGYGLFSWGMVTNAYFSTAARVQGERKQPVITDGPYRFIRHPGYLGMIISSAGTALLLGSWWALLPAAVMAAALIARTHFEDRMLYRELEGYTAYTRHVRYRLMPGIW